MAAITMSGPTAAPTSAPSREGAAEAILRSSEADAGLCVHVGARDGRLTAALARQGRFLVHAIALDQASVEASRQLLSHRGLSGRAVVERLPLHPLPYAANTVNVLVAEDLRAMEAAGFSLDEVLRVLVPRGVAFLGLPGKSGDSMPGLRSAPGDSRPMLSPDFPAEVRRRLDDLGAADLALIRAEGPWVTFRKQWPAGMDEWTHADHGPDGNRVSGDRLVALPDTLKWIAAPRMYMSHSSGPLAWASAGGRVFYVYDEGHPRLTAPTRLNLVARDGFNGALLWRRPVPASGARGGRPYSAYALVAHGDRVYATVGPRRSLQALDARTGEVVLDYRTAPEAVLLQDGLLALLGSDLRVLDAATGDQKWQRPRSGRKIVAAPGFLFAHERRGGAEGVACFNLQTGEERWWRPAEGTLLSHHNGRVLLCTQFGGHRLGLRTTDARRLTAIDAETGRVAWTHDHVGYAVYGIEDAVWYVDLKRGKGSAVAGGADDLTWVGLDVATGREARRLPPYPGGVITHHFLRCAGTNATVRFFITGNTLDLLDVRTGAHSRSSAVRASCHMGLGLANGMLYSFPVECGCFNSLRGVVGAAPGDPLGRPPPPAPDFATGPAHPAPEPEDGPPTSDDDWPCYRHDARRSGGTPVRVAPDLDLLWRADVGPDPTAPTAAGGLVFVASKAAHRLSALDAATGRLRWTFIPGGPLDTPPTIHGGLCFFGCRNGWVYCLRAADGALVWRRRLAPEERRLIAWGRLESPVPVFGSVIVVNDVLHAAAGYTSELDGGIQVYALEPRTGAVKWHETLERTAPAADPPANPRALIEGGVLPDLLQSPGRWLYMGGWQFDLETGRREYHSTGCPDLRAGRTGGFLDDSMKNGWVRRFGLQADGSRGVISGHLLAFSPRTTVGVGIVNPRPRYALVTAPGTGAYSLFARHFDAQGWPDADNPGWEVKATSIAPEAVLVTADVLFAAGPPDAAEPHGGEVWAVSLADGRVLQKTALDAPPVFDGLAAARGRLYLTCQDGSLRCFGRR